MNKSEIIRKLTSRKLWVAVAALVANIIIACGGTDAVAAQVMSIIMGAAVVIAYIIGEGLVDAANVGGDIPDTIKVVACVDNNKE